MVHMGHMGTDDDGDGGRTPHGQDVGVGGSAEASAGASGGTEGDVGVDEK